MATFTAFFKSMSFNHSKEKTINKKIKKKTVPFRQRPVSNTLLIQTMSGIDDVQRVYNITKDDGPPLRRRPLPCCFSLFRGPC